MAKKTLWMGVRAKIAINFIYSHIAFSSIKIFEKVGEGIAYQKGK